MIGMPNDTMWEHQQVESLTSSSGISDIWLSTGHRLVTNSSGIRRAALRLDAAAEHAWIEGPWNTHVQTEFLCGVLESDCGSLGIQEEVWEVMAVGLHEGASDQEITNALRKLHKNLGHCGADDLRRVLLHGKATARALELAKILKCDICDQSHKGHPARPAKTHEFKAPFSSLLMDIKSLPGLPGGHRKKALLMLDEGSSLLVGELITDETSDEVRRAYMKTWFRHYGRPTGV